jgi:hypothetical protein
VGDVPDKLEFVKKMEEIDKELQRRTQHIWNELHPPPKVIPVKKKVRKKATDVAETASTLPDPSIRWMPFIRWNPTHKTAYCSLTVQQEKTRNDQGKIVTRPYIEVFDRRRQRLTIDVIEPYSYAYHIIHMDHIWILTDSDDIARTNVSAGVQWSVIQMRIYPSIFRMNDCFIEEDRRDFPQSCDHHRHNDDDRIASAIANVNKEDHPTFGKYVKMKRIGIPDVAIRQKIVQDGLNPDEFDKWFCMSASSSMTMLSIPIPSAPPSKPPMQVPMANILSAIRGGGISLKKVSGEDRETSKRRPSGIDALKDKFAPPSQDELLKVIARLRRK